MSIVESTIKSVTNGNGRLQDLSSGTTSKTPDILKGIGEVSEG
jgi:hypothetical protein